MASVHKCKQHGRDVYRVSFYDKDGARRFIRLGEIDKRGAESIANRVQQLANCSYAGDLPDRDLAGWLAGRGKDLADKLANVGLIESRASKGQGGATTLGPFLDGYQALRGDVKGSTRLMFKQVRGWLVEYFGADKPLAAINSGDVDEWRLWLAKQGRYEGKLLGKNTIRRHCGRARQCFTVAKKKKLIAENPFSEMKDTSVKANRERDHFVTREDADKVLVACPNTQWKLLFALSRFGGLRCPSEHLALKWSDIDWKAGRMTVHSPKTEHHDGKESRVVPIFPELMPYLEAAKAEAAEGVEQVITIANIRRDRYANPRSTMQKIIKRAGVKPWPKLFHNLRATRQTELAATYPIHVVCEWIGNSPKVAGEHYLRVTDADFNKAAQDRGGTTGGAQVAQTRGPDSVRTDDTKPDSTRQAPVKTWENSVVGRTMSQPVVPGQFTQIAGTGLEPVRP